MLSRILLAHNSRAAAPNMHGSAVPPRHAGTESLKIREQHLQQSLPNLGAGRFAAAAPVHGYSTATPWAQHTAPWTHSTETGITGIGFCETQTASAINHSTGQDSSWAGKKKDTSEQQSCKLGSVSNLCIHTVFCFGLFFFFFFRPRCQNTRKI